MDNLAIKHSLTAENAKGAIAARDKDTSLEKLANTFRQLVTTAGTTFETGLDSISHQAGISGVAKQADAGPATDDYRDSAAREDAPDSSDRVKPRDQDRSDINGRDRRDDAAPRRDDPQGSEARDTRDAGASDHRRSEPAGNDNTKDSAPRENDHADASARSEGGNDQAGKQADSSSSEQTAKSETSGEAQTATDGGAATGNANAQQAAVAGANAGIDVGNSLAAAAAKVDTVTKGESGQLAQNAAQAGPDLLNANKGTASQGSHANTHAGPQANATAGANQAQADAQAETNAKSGAAAQQQAQQIAKSLNPNDKVQINVAVNSDAETLTSRPSNSLTAGTILAAGDGKATNQTGPQNANGQAGNGQNLSVAAVAQQAQAAQAQNQGQQNANQNNQGQAQIQSAATGNAATGGTATQAGTAVHAGGAESAATATGPASASGPAPLTQQSHQSQQAQSEHMSKEAPKGASVTDQISVKISKALQAGNDKISIQLKPAELGRVDVKMELTHDGRVMAVVTADNKDTLDLLRRDSADLQKDLQDAGMQLDSGDLSFNMRGEEGEKMADEKAGAGGSGNGGDGLLDGDIEDLLLAQNTDVISDSRIDVRA
ncbi:MAG: flagellar hook-length control protein FliK [Rhodospirillales bacterium]|nr:flagellar hook-length control protein FliK [Rhodospirillales bacterium]